MSNDYGVCLYQPGAEPGTLDATWYEPGLPVGKPCKGKATGGPATGLAGRYQVTYFGPDNQPVATFDLTIETAGEVFNLTWQQDGKTACTGVGLRDRDGIALAYSVLT